MMHEPQIVPTFEQWWSAYDYKLDRKRCERLWGKMSARDMIAALSHTERYAASTFTDGRFPSRRHPGTYLHNENWNDEALIRNLPSGSGISDQKLRILESIARESKDARDDNG